MIVEHGLPMAFLVFRQLAILMPVAVVILLLLLAFGEQVRARDLKDFKAVLIYMLFLLQNQESISVSLLRSPTDPPP